MLSSLENTTFRFYIFQVHIENKNVSLAAALSMELGNALQVRIDLGKNNLCLATFPYPQPIFTVLEM